MKAVIETGSKQYIVQKGDLLEVELLGDNKTITFEPLMIIDDEKTVIGKPTVKDAIVRAKIVEAKKLTKKVTIVKFQAKKRVYSKNGHRQPVSIVEITDVKTAVKA